MNSEDVKLVEGLKRKDLRAFEELFNQYHRKIFGLIYRLTKNEADAQDLTQEVFLKIFEKADTFEGRSAFSSWIYRIAVNTCFMKMRVQKNQPQVSLETVLPQFLESGYQKEAVRDWSRRADHQMLKQESKQVIYQAIDKLPDKEKIVFILRDVEELSTEKVGEILDLTVPAVKSRLHRARLFLRKRLSQYFERLLITNG